jgi:hypothetical protein
MGLTVHYSGGKAKSQAKIDDCLGFVQNVAEKLPCRFDIINQVLTGNLDDWQHPKNPQTGQLIKVHLKGILLWLDEGCEPLNFSFNYDSLEFCNYFKSSKNNVVNKAGFFCKTQFSKNFLLTHHIVCKLLEVIKENYVRGIKVNDDAQYFGNWDKEKLKNSYEEWTGLISSFGKALDTLDANVDIEQSILQAAQKVQKDEKLKKLFGH